MKKILRQFRYYGDSSSSLNSPEGITVDQLYTGEIFFSSAELRTAKIVAFGIQTVPGVQFYVNDSVESVIIGPSGIYELDLSDGYEITALRFRKTVLQNLIDGNSSAYLIVDVIYEVEE